MTGKFRPQIMASIICGTLFGGFGMWIGLQMAATEIVTAVIGSVFAVSYTHLTLPTKRIV